MQHSTTPDDVTQFAGLTSHNNDDISRRAAKIAGIDSDDPPDASLATALRQLETADTTDNAWKVPDAVAKAVNVNELQQQAPSGVDVYEAKPVDGGDKTVWIRTDRFQSVFSPDKTERWAQGQFTDDDDGWLDALWHNPTKTYGIINPMDAYEHVEQAIRDEDLGDHVFGEIREYKAGGEVHMEMLFDNYSIEYNDDDGDDTSGSEPIVLGIRTGYDFFGSTALYFEGFAQDTRCSNSIRSITDEKTFRHIGDVDMEEEITDIFQQLDLMTDQLAELIEMAEEVEVPMLEMDFAQTFDHDDDIRAFYELLGFPSYLARSAAGHARHRADNRFSPNMTDLWDGATYALTHDFQGGENTSTAREYIDRANDMVYNPAQVVGQVERQHRHRADAEDTDSDDDLAAQSATAKIEEFSQSVRQKRDEFESRQEEMREVLVATADGDGDTEEVAD